MAERVRRRVTVVGHVQGVFFRQSAADEARARGVAGRVWNRDDGAVEAVFEGDRDAVDALVAFCRRGPRQARGHAVDVVDEAPEGTVGFSVG